MKFEKSCGAVVFTRTADGIRYVLGQSIGGEYGFPKGHMEAGETEKETALREIFEEVHLKPRFVEGFRMVSEYMLPNKADTKKQVVFFLAEFENQEIRPQAEELRQAVLVGFDEALALLNHENNREILRKADEFLAKRSTLKRASQGC